MRRELERSVREVSALCGNARVFVLPYPYRGGHLRVYTDQEPELGADYIVQRRGANLFVTIADARLLRALSEMEESLPTATVEPQKGVFETLLYQILKKEWTVQSMDEPLLVRMTLDLDDDGERCRRTLTQMEPLLHKAYAQALRENRKNSVLTAAARQAVYYMHLSNNQERNGESS